MNPTPGFAFFVLCVLAFVCALLWLPHLLKLLG